MLRMIGACTDLLMVLFASHQHSIVVLAEPPLECIRRPHVAIDDCTMNVEAMHIRPVPEVLLRAQDR